MATLSWNEVKEMMKGGRTQDILAAQGGAQTQNQTTPQSAELPGYVATVPRGTGPETAGGDAGYQSGPRKGQGPNAQAVTAANKAALNVDLASGFSKEIKNASDNLQKTANSYVTDTKGYTESQAPTETDITGAIGGDQTAYEKLMGRLGATFGAKEYTPDEKAIKDVGLLANPESRQTVAEEYFGTKTGGRYTAGMSALDQTLFNAQRPDLSPVFKERQDLDSLKESLKAAAKAAREAELAEFDAATGALKTDLQGRATKIREGVTSRMTEAQKAEAAALDEMARAEAARQYESSGIGQIRDDLMGMKTGDKAYDAEVDALVAQAEALGGNIQAGQYVTTNAAQNDIGAYVSPEEAFQFSQIMNLLGQGGPESLLPTGGTPQPGTVSGKEDLTQGITGLRSAIEALAGRVPKPGTTPDTGSPTEELINSTVEDASQISAVDPLTGKMLAAAGIPLPQPESREVTLEGGISGSTPEASRTFETNPTVTAADKAQETGATIYNSDNLKDVATGGAKPVIEAIAEDPNRAANVLTGGVAPAAAAVFDATTNQPTSRTVQTEGGVTGGTGAQTGPIETNPVVSIPSPVAAATEKLITPALSVATGLPPAVIAPIAASVGGKGGGAGAGAPSTASKTPGGASGSIGAGDYGIRL